ncbi:MAG: V-type ATP synthase subunit E [Candidatus Poribacteria bacterium]
MSLEKIIERIKQDAQAQIAEIKDKASKEADKILQNAKNEAESYKAQALERAKIQAQQRKQRLISSANLEFRKEILAEKQKAIDLAFQEAVNTLVQMKDDEYRQIIKKMLISSVQTGDEEIILSPRDKTRINENFVKEINKELVKLGKKGNLKISKNNYNILGGFVLKKGNIEINNSFETLFKSFRDELEAEVSKVLFG